MAEIRAASHGTTLRSSGFGGLTTPFTLHGFRVMRSSATAALRIVERVWSTSLMWEGASGLSSLACKPRSHAWMTLGLRRSSQPYLGPRGTGAAPAT